MTTYTASQQAVDAFNETYSGSTLFHSNKLQGVFWFQNARYVCTGGCSYRHRMECIWASRLYTPDEWKEIEEHAYPRDRWGEPGHSFYYGRRVDYRGTTFIMGEKIEIEATEAREQGEMFE